MTPEQTELFRLALLRVLDANRTRFGLSLAAIRLHLVVYGFANAGEEDLIETVDYLSGKGLAEEVPKRLSAYVRSWRITNQGLAFMDSGV